MKSAFVLGLEGEVERGQDGKPKRLAGWEKVATDQMGRTFNAKLHGPAPELDNRGYLKVKRRDNPKPMIPGGTLDDTLSIHKTEGYAYYFVNEKPGRRERMTAHDWEAVQGSEGPVRLKLSNQALGAESTVLMRKPLEWYEEDQRAKEARVIHQLEANASTTGPERPGKVGYGDGLREDTPLR